MRVTCKTSSHRIIFKQSRLANIKYTNTTTLSPYHYAHCSRALLSRTARRVVLCQPPSSSNALAISLSASTRSITLSTLASTRAASLLSDSLCASSLASTRSSPRSSSRRFATKRCPRLSKRSDLARTSSRETEDDEDDEDDVNASEVDARIWRARARARVCEQLV